MMFLRSCKLCLRRINKFGNHLEKHSSNLQAETPVYHAFPMEFKAPKGVEKNDKLAVITSRRKEMNCYLGDKYEKLGHRNLVSGGWSSIKSKGDYFVIHPLPDNEHATCNDLLEGNKFSDFPLNQGIIRKLDQADIQKPTKIQKIAIPEILNGSSSVLAAETGCGKTLAYLLPLLEQVFTWKKLEHMDDKFNSPCAIIIAPTKELAEQIGAKARTFSRDLGISVKTITNRRGRDLMNHPPVDNIDILVGSFGLINKLVAVDVYKVDYVRHVILDEADALFHETFESKVGSFLQKVMLNRNNPMGGSSKSSDGLGEGVQITLASATMPRRMSEVLCELINMDNLRILATESLHRISVSQKFLRVGPGQKPAELLKYIKPKLSEKNHIIIFTNETRTSDWLKLFLEAASINAIRINGAMPLNERHGLYKKFLSGEIRILSTTNAGSRGLDTTMVKHVLNYDFPLDTADYVHRCGRTGRLGSGKNCTVTSFVSSARDVALVRQIEKCARENKPIPLINTFKNLPYHEDSDGNEENDRHYNYLESIVRKSEQDNNVPI